jgi:hypothetical protein
MIVFQADRESLDLNIQFDLLTGLPLYSERNKLLELVLTYLPLPYSIAEYGCGSKASIIINKLIDFGVPVYALKRGMIMEKDMSDEALNELNYEKRPHALIIDNPLYEGTDFSVENFIEILESESLSVEVEGNKIYTGQYVLSHEKKLQFVQARSHIFTIVTFWDDDSNDTTDLIIDPTIQPDSLFAVDELRGFLRAEESWIFTASLLGNFRLVNEYLTVAQKKKIDDLLGKITLEDLSLDDHSDLIKVLNSSSAGSIGDPDQWTYANNIKNTNEDSNARQSVNTGKGDVIKDIFYKLIYSRKSLADDVLKLRDELNITAEKLGLRNIIKEDAELSEKQLVGLASVASTISYYRAIDQIQRWIHSGVNLYDLLDDIRNLDKAKGIGVRLRQRIERLADVSEDEEGKIDARALSSRYLDAVLTTIVQMNRAGLSVFIDKVGNIHGLLIDKSVLKGIQAGKLEIKEICSDALCLCSHIDTVKDAGKYDGRLGVLSGTEIAHVFFDLGRYFNINTLYPHQEKVLMVTSFIAEEMTFTGNGISMPGSSAFAGIASPESIYSMTNNKGEVYGDKLIQMLEFLKQLKNKKVINLVNDFGAKDSKDLLNSCYEPSDFYTQYTYERHIEQGPILDRRGIPLVHVDTIMGLHQEDLMIEGENAESAALEINRRLRVFSLLEQYPEIRVTVGIIDSSTDDRILLKTDFGLRWTITGEKNHAGATLLQDRSDPGVAAGKLVNSLHFLIDKINNSQGTKLKAIVGGIELLPGTDRNVIPESIEFTIAIVNGTLSEEDKRYISLSLKNLAITVLSLPVSEGGEGVKKCIIVPIDFVNLSKKERLSIDLRGSDKDTITRFLYDFGRVYKEVETKYKVDIRPQLQQQFDPIDLDRTGQVLQIERSYGGSHNPNEAELSNDLLRGSIIQFAITRDFLDGASFSETNLFHYVKSKVPTRWSNSLKRFVSGALHDTCNIAARVMMSR